MDHATSPDGTRIAYRQTGRGRPIVIVGGALSTGASSQPLAEALAAAGLRAVTWDRRGRADSGDTPPYATEREVEDLCAVLEAVDGDPAVVFGHSAGAVLALLAAGAGVPMTHLFLSEPPLRFGEDEPPADLANRLQALVDDRRPEEAIVTFQRENVRLTEPQIEQLRQSSDFAPMLPLAQTTVYDTLLTVPTPALPDIDVPVTVLHGDPAAPVIITACNRLAAALPGADLVVVPESHNHAVDPTGTVREVVARID